MASKSRKITQTVEQTQDEAALPRMYPDREYYELNLRTARQWRFVVERPDDADELWVHWADRAAAGVGAPDEEQVKKFADAHDALSKRILSLVVRVKAGLRETEDQAAWLADLRENRRPVPVANALIVQLPIVFLGDNEVALGDEVKNG